MNNYSFIGSLHRPFNTRLKTCKWVCVFTKEYKGTNFKNDFFIYIVKFLYQYYQNNESIYGLPKKETIEILYNYILNHADIQTDLNRFSDPSKKNDTEIDKKLFSNLKAVGYYITLSKALNFIGSKHTLTEEGKELAQLKQSPKDLMTLTDKESFLFIKQIFQNDFVPFIFTLQFYRLREKYTPKTNQGNEIDDALLNTLDTFLQIREFKYKQSSWRNYIIVRENWINDLNILTTQFTLKPKYKKIIENNPNWSNIYNKIDRITQESENTFKTLNQYEDFKRSLNKAYKYVKNNMFLKNINYVNLYDIKDYLKMPFNHFETMLNRLAFDKNNRKKVFFNNIIAALDTRKRFKVKNSSVLNIRITKDLT